jgi:hypothetical protein
MLIKKIKTFSLARCRRPPHLLDPKASGRGAAGSIAGEREREENLECTYIVYDTID